MCTAASSLSVELIPIFSSQKLLLPMLESWCAPCCHALPPLLTLLFVSVVEQAKPPLTSMHVPCVPSAAHPLETSALAETHCPIVLSRNEGTGGAYEVRVRYSNLPRLSGDDVIRLWRGHANITWSDESSRFPLSGAMHCNDLLSAHGQHATRLSYRLVSRCACRHLGMGVLNSVKRPH